MPVPTLGALAAKLRREVPIAPTPEGEDLVAAMRHSLLICKTECLEFPVPGDKYAQVHA